MPSPPHPRRDAASWPGAALLGSVCLFLGAGLGIAWLGLHLGTSLLPTDPPRAPAVRPPQHTSPPIPLATVQVPPTPTPGTAATNVKDERLTVLLLGLDQRPDQHGHGSDPGRTDALILVTIDFTAPSVALVSIPRDGYVRVPGHGNERINAAFTLGELASPGGGPALAKRTVAELFGAPVERYALVDLSGLVRVIDALGGVWLEVPERLYDPAFPTDDYGTMVLDIPAGRQWMDGAMALRYARTRHPDSDFGRQTRQQQVLLGLREGALRLDVLPRLPALLPELLRLVQTDLGADELIRLATASRQLSGEAVSTLAPDPSLTPSFTGASGAAYVELTPAYRAAVQHLVLGTPASDGPVVDAVPTAVPAAELASGPQRPPTPPTSSNSPQADQYVVVRTGGLGALLRAEPVTGQPLASVPDDQVLEVLRRSASDGGWLRVRTNQGLEGWIASRVVEP